MIKSFVKNLIPPNFHLIHKKKGLFPIYSEEELFYPHQKPVGEKHYDSYIS